MKHSRHTSAPHSILLGVRWLVLVLAVGCGHSAASSGDDDMQQDAAADTTDSAAPLANRDRLIHTYFEFLKADPSATQSNGLSGSNLTDVCDLWSKLQPAAQQTFLTITARLDGSKLGSDSSSMLDHIAKLYRVVGGENATASDPGSCGGGEFNRMIMSMDAALHTAMSAAFTNQGASGDIADIPSGGFWRDSHDAGGPHAPFDQSDETDGGAPRGQTQYFKDPASTAATSPLGRLDLMTLVDPLAIEMDQDYDCTHNSNPGCSYTFYGPACIPETTMVGVDIYTEGYGSYEADWKPSGC
jgi:hypothetical protein